MIHIESLYIFIILILSNFIFKTSNAIPTSWGESVNTTNSTVCTSDICFKTAAQIIFNMDSSIDPCDDFYKFACGGYLMKKNISNDSSMITVSTETQRALAQKIKYILEIPSQANESKTVHLVKNFYKSCMNESVIERRGFVPLLRILRKQLGGWPVIEGKNWEESKFHWAKAVFVFKKIGFPIHYFLDVDVHPNFKNSSKNDLMISQADLGSMRENFIKGIKDKSVKAYKKMMIDIALLFGASNNYTVTKELTESLEFEIALANITISMAQIRSNIKNAYNPITLGELNERYPSIKWKFFLNNILQPYAQLNDNDTVNVVVPEFIPKFIQLISKTPKRIQANYVVWKAIQYSIPFLSKNVQNIWLTYLSETTGTTALLSRWETCVNQARKLHGTESMYLKHYIKENDKIYIDEILTNIKNEMMIILQQAGWMDNETKMHALHKLMNMSDFIGYPRALFNITLLDEFYKDLNFDNQMFLRNYLRLQRFYRDISYKTLKEPVPPKSWKNFPNILTINAYYSILHNSIQLPAGILQGPFFNIHRPKYMNYGGIGIVIGHEITHGFDNIGRKFNEYGSLENWWSSSTNVEFYNKSQCLVDQYSKYNIDSINKKLNGVVTQDENVADNGGFKIAYLAYKNLIKKHEPEKLLPGLHYNPSQMFWISAANIFCAKVRPKYLEHLSSRYHSPYKLRILGSLSNSREFAEDFECPVGSKMNPKNKCRVW